MSLQNNKLKQGFTIVELLIVIVVIGILAAITIVAYNGITVRANVSKTQSNADSIRSVAEAYNADIGYYPQTIANFSLTTLTARLPSGITLQAAAPLVTNGTTNFQYHYCGSVAAPTPAQTKGGRITYWDFNAGTATGVLYVGSGSATTGADPCHTYVVTS